jgi:hypothetical protein
VAAIHLKVNGKPERAYLDLATPFRKLDLSWF